MRKTTFLLSLCMVLLCCLTACYMPSTDVEYALSEDGTCAMVVGVGDGVTGRVVIADTYEGKYVTEIAEGAFAGSRVETVYLTPNIRRIGQRAFADCEALTYLNVPAYVTEIGEAAFENCEKLGSVGLEKNSQLKSIGAAAFRGCTALTAFAVPSGVTVIGAEAFAGCDRLSSLTLGASLQTIGDRAFMDCAALSGVSFPSTLTAIGKECFLGCKALTSASFAEPYGWSVSASADATQDFYLSLGYPDADARLLTQDYASFYWRRY